MNIKLQKKTARKNRKTKEKILHFHENFRKLKRETEKHEARIEMKSTPSRGKLELYTSQMHAQREAGIEIMSVALPSLSHPCLCSDQT